MSDKAPALRIAKLSEIVPDRRNANRHTARGQGIVETSLRQRGFFRPMAAAGKDVSQPVMLAGNLTQEAALGIGLDEAIIIETDGTRPIVHVRTDVAPGSEEARRLGYDDNRGAELSLDWDPLILQEDQDLLAGLWTDDELTDLFATIEQGTGAAPGEDSGPQLDKAEELRAQWGVEGGQLWQLGAHRLLCGDATKREDVARVLEGQTVPLCLTDPPYGVGVEYAAFTDSTPQVAALAARWLPLARQAAQTVVFSPGIAGLWLYPAPSWVLCWFYGAGPFQSPWGFNCWQPFLCYGKDPSLAQQLGSRPDAVNLNIPANAQDLAHPCPKPLPLWLWLLERLSFRTDDCVFDPFSGSGTTLIACERLHRKCRAIEISPAYVAVALQRWADMTGQEPARL